ncbi:MAG: hypothetical protein KC731_03620 [Myxococcales bacterium]|nr:hypothetical protein [Myxococcales bacterium]
MTVLMGRLQSNLAVLVVCPDPERAGALVALLREGLGCRAEAVATIDAAFGAVATCRVDVVVTAAQVGPKSGELVLRELRTIEPELRGVVWGGGVPREDLPRLIGPLSSERLESVLAGGVAAA